MLALTRDEDGDWVAHLDCLHRQHVRHDPPMRFAEWVVDDAERAARIGGPLDCPLCDRAELPADLVVLRVTDTWTESTMPGGLRRDHRVARETWGNLVVEAGRLRFRAATSPPIDRVVGAGGEQPIPPDVVHSVEPLGPVRFRVEFLGRQGSGGEAAT